MSRLFLYEVDLKYNRNLANHDDNVLSISPQVGKENRPYVGVLVLINGKQYCAPITSPKPKHSTMPKNFDYLKVFDKDKLIAVINFNNMIPVCPAVIRKIDVQIKKNDLPAVKIYKELLTKELDWCQKNSILIQKNAQKTYDAVTLGKGNANLIRRCCDFKKLEQVLEYWQENKRQRTNNSAHNIPVSHNERPKPQNPFHSSKKMTLNEMIEYVHRNDNVSQKKDHQQQNKPLQPHKPTKPKRSGHDDR